MSKTFFKDLFKTIKNSWVTFFAICCFVSMSLALFLGIEWSSRCAFESTDYYFNQTNIYDIQLNFSTGFKDVERLLEIEGVDEVEGGFTFTSEMKNDSNGFELRISTMPKIIDTPCNIEGNLPSKKGEAALIRYWAEDNNYKIGDQIIINNDVVMLNNRAFSTDTFTITALVDFSTYNAKKTTLFGVSPVNFIPINGHFFVDESSFNPLIPTYIGYNQVNIRSNSLRQFSFFSDEYEKQTDEIISNIKASDLLKDTTFVSIRSIDSNPSYNIRTMTLVLSKVKFSMASLFVVVGILVSFFSIKRLISEGKTSIGTKKANGFSNKQIYLFYILYVAIATLVGCLIGIALAYFVCERVIFNSVAQALIFPHIFYQISFGDICLFFLFELVIQCIIAFISSRKILKTKAIDLLKDENESRSKKRFYQKSSFWNKLSLFSKTLVNNLVNDKTRVVSMLVGIGGCAALLVSALTIDANINNSFKKEYTDIISFQSIVYYDSDKNIDGLLKTLDEKNYGHEEIMLTYLTIDCPNNKTVTLQTYIFDDDSNFDDFVKMYSNNNEIIEFKDGIYLSCSYKEFFNLDNETKIEGINGKNEKFEITTTAFFKHYLVNNVAFMNAKTYKDCFDGTYKKNASLINLNGSSYEQLNKDVVSNEAVIYVFDQYTAGQAAFNIIANIFKVVDVVYIVLSILLALLVVFDLLTMFINEKRFELITLIVNGYSRKHAKKYIYFDTVIVSILGIAFGVLLGSLMSRWTIDGFRSETLYFLNGFNLLSSSIGVIICALIILIITLTALKKINKFKLSDLNKTNQ